MKKLFVIVLAAIGMVSCMNTDEVIEVNNDNAIAFADAFIENSVRAIIENGNDPDQFNQFKVWGWMKEGAVEAPVFTGRDVENNGAGWTYSPAQYWVPGFTYTFKALSSNGGDGWNAAETAVGNGHLGVVNFTNNNGTEDLIYATATVDAPALGATKTVELSFNHQLAKIGFAITTGQEFTTAGVTLNVHDIEMVVPESATICYSDNVPTWALGSGTTTLEFGAGNVELLTIPAEDYEYAITFKVDYIQNGQTLKTFDKTSSVTLDVAMGNSYRFTAELTPENMGMSTVEFDTTVNPWNPNDQPFEPGRVEVGTTDDFLAAVADPGVSIINLTENITLESALKFGAVATSRADNALPGRSLEINGNGKTIEIVKLNGSNVRFIDVTSEANGANFTLKNLTINYNAGKWIERIINYNTNGTLTLDGVKILNAVGSTSNYAVNLPASSDNAKVIIKDSEIWAGANALNIWGAKVVANITNSKLYVVDANPVEGYSVIALNNQGDNAAHYSVVNIEGGEVKVVYEGEGETQPSSALRDATNGSVINISESTVVVGDVKIPVANVVYEGYNEFYSFTTVQAAIDKVQADKNGTVQLIKDLKLTKKLTVKAGHPVTIDLAGYTISATDNATGSWALITNQANLTIKDSEGNGKMTVVATNNRGWNAYSSVISNTVGGNLVVEGGIIEHLGGTDMAYGIDNLTNGKGTYAVTTVKDATVKSTYSAVRQFLNGTEATNELYVKAGAELYSPNRAVFFQDPSKNANTGKLVIEAGAKVTGKVYLSSTAGSTEWPVEVSVAASALTEGSVVAHSEVLPAGYAVVLENGVYTVVEAAAVTTAEELAAAVANKLETIYVSGEIDLANVILSGYNGTIVGLDNTAVLNTRNFIPSVDECYQLHCEAINFKNITVKVPTEDGDFLKTGFVGFGAIQFDNCVFKGQVTLNGQATWTFNNCVFGDVENGAYASFVYGAAKAIFNNCSFSGVDRAAKIYGTGGELDVEYNNCTFTSTTSNKAAVNIDASYATTTVVLNGCSQTGMPSLYAVAGAKATVTVK